MSGRPLLKRADAEAVLRQCRISNEPAFEDAQFLPGGLGHSLAVDELESAAHFIASVASPEPARVISDLNLVPEYRHGADPPFSWMKALMPPGVGTD
jgi:hypothetical protein